MKANGALAAFIGALHVDWAMLEAIKAEFQSVIQVTHVQMASAPAIGAVQERTMIDVFGHITAIRRGHLAAPGAEVLSARFGDKGEKRRAGFVIGVVC
ncbi:MAG TPA: hypothetical protein VGG19_11665 [Tepidisphaeraceae bacterium]|jgi:hypothetical protein